MPFMLKVRVVHHANDRHFGKAVNAALDELSKVAKIERVSYDTTVLTSSLP
jgi:predicted transcriptional regulator